ncbi:MAG: ABC transporter permease [Rhodobacteraceae bacterium]|nr:ABC transporter permease [Paracoccaceae bacterium]MCP5341745.1 ABC transporter permease [Paracoccaceae bacterium]
MKLIVGLSLRDLFQDWVHLLCNVAVMVGVIVPLLVLFGVRNGVYDALLGQLLNNPATLQIDTRGNNSFTQADADELRGWPEAGFVTLKTRSLFDYVNVRETGGRGKREAIIAPSGNGDPMLGPGVRLGPDDAAISTALATQLNLTPGQSIDLITQAPDRPRQLVLPVRVIAIIPEDRLSGRVVLAALDKLDLIEAFYDEYALPEHGITAGKPLDQRVVDFEGIRAYAKRLQDLAPLQARIEERFGVATEAATSRVTSVLGLGRNLGLALALTAFVAGIGLAAALVFGFWGEVARKRQMIAHLGLLGISQWHVSAFPVIQALVTAILGLAVSFILFAIAAAAAEQLFETGLTEQGGLVVIGWGQALIICIGVMVFVMLASLVAARSAQRTDPATVLREFS